MSNNWRNTTRRWKKVCEIKLQLYKSPWESVYYLSSSETQGQSVASGEKARWKFSSTGDRAPGYRLSPNHFQKFKRIPAPDWAQKMLCIIVPNRRTVSPGFFSCVWYTLGLQGWWFVWIYQLSWNEYNKAWLNTNWLKHWIYLPYSSRNCFESLEYSEECIASIHKNCYFHLRSKAFYTK